MQAFYLILVAFFIHLAVDHMYSLTALVDANPRHGQSGVTWIEFVVILFDNNSFHLSPASEFL